MESLHLTDIKNMSDSALAAAINTHLSAAENGSADQSLLMTRVNLLSQELTSRKQEKQAALFTKFFYIIIGLLVLTTLMTAVDLSSGGHSGAKAGKHKTAK